MATLLKINSADDIDVNLKNKRKQNIFKALKQDTDEKIEKSGQRKSKFSYLDQLKKDNMNS